LAAALRVVSAGAAPVQLPHHRLMEERPVDRRAEDGRIEIEGPARLPARVDDVDPHRARIRHGLAHAFFLATRCALDSFTLFRIRRSPPVAPGTAPLTTRRCCSGSTRTTSRWGVVTRTAPMRPGRRCPGKTREGSDDAPIEPGARWNIEPCEASPPVHPWRLIPPWKPRPFRRPVPSTNSPGWKRSTPIVW